MLAPPGAFDALGAFGGDHFMQRAAPAKAQRRAVRHLRDRLDRFRPRQQPQRTRRKRGLFPITAKRSPAGIAIDGLRGKCGFGHFRNVAVLRGQPLHAARAQPRAQAIDQAAKLGLIFSAANADLLRRGGLDNDDGQPRHVEAEARVECIGQRGEAFNKQPADFIRIAQRPRGAGRDAADHAVGAE